MKHEKYSMEKVLSLILLNHIFFLSDVLAGFAFGMASTRIHTFASRNAFSF